MSQIAAEHVYASFDIQTGEIAGRPSVKRHLSDLRGVFADTAAYEAALALGDPVVYMVSSVEPAEGDGQLHYGVGVLMPGRIGAEYYLTKGHLHAWRPAAEVYIGLSGEGAMLLEDEQTGETSLVPLRANSVVYVPGFTAHRTINTHDTPLIYIGVYPAAAGHDYGAIAERNFQHVLAAIDDQPALIDRAAFVAALATDDKARKQ
ncbi:MAG TPA: glucose-6-phosphate isomerase family protein [Roseiflexaceae bacterium]|nr:glucose-6-phosphate isomerase family protein [Roseiflexaceae bacterium]